jgi:hypothetical protein
MDIRSLTGTAAAAIRYRFLAIALAGTFGGVAHSENAIAHHAETAARNDAIVRAAFDGWRAGSGNVFDLLSPSIHWTIHGSGPVAGTYRGIEDFVQRASRPLVSRLATPLTPRVHHIGAVGDRVIIRFDASAMTTGGDPYRNQFVWIFRMEDGFVVEAEAFLDLVAYQDVIEANEPRTPTKEGPRPGAHRRPAGRSD